MKRVVVVLMLAVLLLASITANNVQKLYPVDSPVYGAIRILYSEIGIAPPSSSGPWNTAELQDMVERISRDKLSESGKALYENIVESLDLRDMSEVTYQGRIGFEPAFEMYIHQDDVNYQQDTDWVYDYDHRKPLLTIPVEMFMTDYIYGYTEMAILKTRFSKTDGGAYDSSEMFAPKVNNNFPFDEALVNHVDLNFPEKAVASIGTGRLNVTIGRDDLRWGSGRTGSMTVIP